MKYASYCVILERVNKWMSHLHYGRVDSDIQKRNYFNSTTNPVVHSHFYCENKRNISVNLVRAVIGLLHYFPSGDISQSGHVHKELQTWYKDGTSFLGNVSQLFINTGSKEYIGEIQHGWIKYNPVIWSVSFKLQGVSSIEIIKITIRCFTNKFIPIKFYLNQCKSILFYSRPVSLEVIEYIN